MPLDHYVTLGRTGLRVSPMCLGTMTFGEDWGWGSSVEDSQRLLDVYLERGGNFVDTANAYTKGHSEQIIGDHLGRHADRRDRVVIATKFCGNLYRGDPNGGGAGRKAIVQACEQSLRRLQTDRIDLYWMHNWDKFTPIDETLRALDDLIRAGKVLYVGASDTPAWKVAQANTLAELRGWSRFVGIQVEYSLLERTIEGNLLPMAAELGLGVTPWGPLKGGALSGKFTRANAGSVDPNRGAWVSSVFNDRVYDLIDTLHTIAGELGVTPAQVALSWVQSRPGVTSTIIGARTMEQLEANLAALDVVLPPQTRAILDELTAPTLEFPTPFLNHVTGFNGGGTTLNGEELGVFELAPTGDDDRY